MSLRVPMQVAENAPLSSIVTLLMTLLGFGLKLSSMLVQLFLCCLAYLKSSAADIMGDVGEDEMIKLGQQDGCVYGGFSLLSASGSSSVITPTTVNRRRTKWPACKEETAHTNVRPNYGLKDAVASLLAVHMQTVHVLQGMSLTRRKYCGLLELLGDHSIKLQSVYRIWRDGTTVVDLLCCVSDTQRLLFVICKDHYVFGASISASVEVWSRPISRRGEDASAPGVVTCQLGGQVISQVSFIAIDTRIALQWTGTDGRLCNTWGKLKDDADGNVVCVLMTDMTDTIIPACKPIELEDGSTIRPVYLLEILADLSFGLFPRLAHDPPIKWERLTLEKFGWACVASLLTANRNNDQSWDALLALGKKVSFRQEEYAQEGDQLTSLEVLALMIRGEIAGTIAVGGQQNRTADYLKFFFTPPQPHNDPSIVGVGQMDAFYETAGDEDRDLTLPVIGIV
ncbi:unnamed protein product [Vitrella brassicaformis CCMP3155]|uniref:Uncharacterized protein n=1 Tax=Vitrella brassicaformis (strain CCMP3155) TaxID=1169540 RepID=A0A0G4G9E0_VITBC|nr:unnamed protein product [Vitrella brassicaformis CCMP3155]|eukprot:CEM25449.1 unnamed protein product [Vitrella brassicaformis CCMP3155]